MTSFSRLYAQYDLSRQLIRRLIIKDRSREKGHDDRRLFFSIPLPAGIEIKN
jgi:hypothetical protein